MNLKNLILTLLCIFAASQPIRAEKTVAPTPKMTNKEVAIKSAKITGYFAELIISAFYFYLVQESENAYSFRLALNHFYDEEYTETARDLGYQVPFLATMGHAINGLVTEFKPLAQARFQAKLQKKLQKNAESKS